MSDLRAGQIVRGVVTEHRYFGVFIDIGEAEPALAVVTMLEDEPVRAMLQCLLSEPMWRRCFSDTGARATRLG